MESEILFLEKQKFRQWWLWAILLIINVIMLWGAFQQIINGEQLGDKPMSNWGLLLTTTPLLLITLLIFTIRLDTLIKKDGIYVRFFPFHWSFKKFSWDKILLCQNMEDGA